ncbi:hypothetical protein BLNAU_19490 [Blattamonas nauphoetae]|uniref:OTU domain-containing protein n=1 Tax=Blattamonas nauphoetae TaxID=2049346 RepID=A0ABQ9X1C3_9EUKA|nr:hypothetical protein BLNAU_19490 [Blattamonas nauphoetae]
MVDARNSKSGYKQRMNPSIYHIVTGTPGIGKSAIRMPLITLTMSLGVNEVKTARHGEPSFIFRNRNKITNTTAPIPCDYDENSFQWNKLDPIGKAFITINRGNEPPVLIERDTFCYTYDVFMSLPSTDNEKIYHPEKVFSSEIPLGALTVPSFHHFPHFFKLFVNQNNQIENRLRGTTWHIVDDFIVHSSHIPLCEHVVLLTSPAKERWENIATGKQLNAPIFLYNVPTLLFPEMIHMFNAIPCPYRFSTAPKSLMMQSQASIQKQGMIPRSMFDTIVKDPENDKPESSEIKEYSRDDYFGRGTSHRYIHSSSPQFDPMNWFTQHATQDSYKIVQERTTRKINKPATLNLVKRESKDIGQIKYSIKHEEIYLSDVEKGLTLTALRPINQTTIPKTPIKLPKTKYSLNQKMSTPTGIQTITIPHPRYLSSFEAHAYDSHFNFLFQHCLHKEALPLNIQFEIDEPWDKDNDFVIDEKKSKLLNQMQVITSHLVPDDPRNAGFDSILLMFRCKKVPFELHSLAVVFLQGTAAGKHGISPGGVHLMKRWCYDLARNFHLRRVQIFPHFIVAKDAVRFPEFTLYDTDNLRNFIPEQNIWIAKFEAHGKVEAGDPRIPPMTASATPILARYLKEEVNKDPRAVRCAYCGTLVTKNFPDHYCDGLQMRSPTIEPDKGLIGTLDRSNKLDVQPADEPVYTEFLEEDIFVDFVKDPSDIQRENVSSGSTPPPKSSSHQKEYVEVTCTSVIPDPPDVYRTPFCPPPPGTGRTETIQNQHHSEDIKNEPNDVRRDTSPQLLLERLNDPSNIKEAHCIWADGHQLSYEQGRNWQFKPVKLAEQPYKSLQFDFPSIDITDITHNAQYMLPSVTIQRFSPLDVSSNTVTDSLGSKRDKCEYFWQWLNRKNPPTGMVAALQADEAELTKRIQNCGNETEKSHLTCLLAKGLLLRSRLSIQSGDLKTAEWFLEQSKQHMVLNDTTEVDCELKLARSNRQTTSSHGFAEMERAAANARVCFGINWEQWIQEGHNLPILLNPSFYRLRCHLSQVQDHVNRLMWYLDILKGARNTGERQTTETRRTIASNAIIQALKEGLRLQLRIAWKIGSEFDVKSFKQDLNSLDGTEGDMAVQSLTTPFKSQEMQIEELSIADMTSAIGNVLNTTLNHCNTWDALDRHQHTLSSISIHKGVQHDIRTSAQILLQRITTIRDLCRHKLKETGDHSTINAVKQTKNKLNQLLQKPSNLGAIEGNIEDRSDQMGIDELKGETGFPEETATTFDEKDFGKQKHLIEDNIKETVNTPSDVTRTRPSIDPSLIPFLSFLFGPPNSWESADVQSDRSRDTDQVLFFRDILGSGNVENVLGDGNCWLRALLDQLTPDDLVDSGIIERGQTRHIELVNAILLPDQKHYRELKAELLSSVRNRLVEDMLADIKHLRKFIVKSEFPTEEDYIKNLKNDRQWGGDLEFPYLARIFQKQIAILRPYFAPSTLYGDGPIITIAFCDDCHYISLRNVPEDLIMPPTPVNKEENKEGTAAPSEEMNKEGAAPSKETNKEGAAPSKETNKEGAAPSKETNKEGAAPSKKATTKGSKKKKRKPGNS